MSKRVNSRHQSLNSALRQTDRFGAEGLGERVIRGFSDDTDDWFGVAGADLDPAIWPVETQAVAFGRCG